MELLEELAALERELRKDPSPRNRAARRRFWRLVGRIKRLDRPDPELVERTSEVRDLLYRHSLGRALPLGWLMIWLVCGVGSIAYYLWLVTLEGRVTGHFSADYDLGLAALASVFFLYPFGRLIAGSLLGIRFDGITRDIYLLPTLKINYRSYLLASPPRRMWFFFWAGVWTTVNLLAVGAVGYLLAGEWSALAYGVALGLSEAGAAVVGTRWGGELGHFRRERFIVRDWRRATG